MSSGLSIEFDASSFGLSSMGEAIKQNLSGVVVQTATDVVATAQEEIMRGEKTGRIYMVGGETVVTFNAGLTGDDGPGSAREKIVTFNAGKAGREHQASAPGEAPATEIGDLVNSGAVDVIGPFEADAVFSSEHAAPLEFGTVSIEPRPFVGPSLQANEERFFERAQAAMNQAMAEGH